MAKETRAIWAERVEGWRASGLTAEEYASKLGVNARTLVYWKWKLGKEGLRAERIVPKRRPSEERLSFVEVRATAIATGTPIEVVLGEVTVRVRDGFSAETLRGVLDVIREAR
jgi:hypothetical protein